ncbi:MAG: head GIN domain-containing protein [Bacteroidota bacterium]
MKSTKRFKTIILLLALITSITLNSCDDDINFNGNCISGEGATVTQILTLSDFDGIELSVEGNVIVSQGPTQEVKVTGQQNIIENLSTSVSNGLWTITSENGCFKNYDLTVEIIIPDLNLLNITGSGNINVNDFNNQNTLTIRITGSGNMTLNQFEGITNLNTTLTGSGTFRANSDILTLETLTVGISGSGEYKGFEISSNNCSVNVSGSGRSELTAIESLNVVISGSGTVAYKGSPSISQTITGSGRVVDAN